MTDDIESGMKGRAKMSDMYRDTDERMRDDVEFAAAVHYMMQLAEQSGFTPGELKQIAFRASLELEMRRPPQPVCLKVSER